MVLFKKKDLVYAQSKINKDSILIVICLEKKTEVTSKNHESNYHQFSTTKNLSDGKKDARCISINVSKIDAADYEKNHYLQTQVNEYNTISNPKKVSNRKQLILEKVSRSKKRLKSSISSISSTDFVIKKNLNAIALSPDKFYQECESHKSVLLPFFVEEISEKYLIKTKQLNSSISENLEIIRIKSSFLVHSIPLKLNRINKCQNVYYSKSRWKLKASKHTK